MKKKNKFSLLMLTAFFSAQALAILPQPIDVTGGKISGITSLDKKISIFKGIPYAQPPLGELRWKHPQPVVNWKNVKKTNSFSAGCMQPQEPGDFLPWTKEFLHQGEINEDCLYLNIWTPAQQKDEKLPVVIFIHGGGFTNGSGSVPLYDGEALARKGIIFITINYRLGIFGFFAHPALTKEAGSSGNYGLYDQLAAIKWVKENIKNFGGDEKNITLMGQSAGAYSITVLNTSPLANGLYQKAIIESSVEVLLPTSGNSPLSSLGIPLAQAETENAKWSQNVGYSSLDALRKAPAKELLHKATTDAGYQDLVIDGKLFTDRIPNIYQQNKQNDVAILSGMNSDERSGFSADYGSWGIKQLSQYILQHYPKNSNAMFQLYAARSDDEAMLRQKELFSDEGVYALQQAAKLRVMHGKQANYLYYFEKAIPWPEHPEFGAFHSGELPYIFHNIQQLNRPWSQQDYHLENVLSSYWVNFAKNSNPNSSGLKKWQNFTHNAQDLLCAGSDIKMCHRLSDKKVAMLKMRVE